MVSAQDSGSKRKRYFACVLLTTALAGCGRIPPAQIQATATDYNIVLQRTSGEQLLLNLVRLRYHESPYFMEPSAVSAQLRRTVEISAQAALADASITQKSAGVAGRLGFTEQPTLTFVPLRGEAFMERMLSRLDLRTLLLLYHSGWDIERVFRLCVHSMNHTINRLPGTSERAATSATSEPFYELMHLLQVLQQSGSIDFGYTSNGADAAAVMSLAPGESDPALADFRDRMHLAKNRAVYKLELGTIAEAHDPTSLVVGTRSLMGILLFLSRAVDIPASDEGRKVAAVTRDSEGNPIDWANATAGTLHVHVSDTAPTPESTRTYYRGHWFYIDDADLESKSTLTLLSQIFSIQSGAASSFAPVLTLPTGDSP